MVKSTTYTYPFDASGKSTANLIEREVHTVQFSGDKATVFPDASPFFKEGLIVYNTQSGDVYTENKDYVLGHSFVAASESIGRPIYGSIVFLNQSIAKLVSVTYQTLGGIWGVSANGLTTELTNTLFNPIVRNWEEIEGLPEAFPPISHDQNISDFVGSDQLLAGLREIADAIVQNSEGVSSGHMVDYNNPHRVTAVQVGLGNVPNYNIATEEEAKLGESNGAFMSPLRTFQAIDVHIKPVLDEHTTDTKNPHNVTAKQVGLGNVKNYGVATDADIVSGVATDLYVTVNHLARYFELHSASVEVGSIKTALTDHVNNKDNPHGTTAAQVGTYDKEEIDKMVQSVQAQNTSKFAGKTEQQWRDSLPSDDDITSIEKQISELFSTHATDISGIAIVDGQTNNQVVVSNVVAGYNMYAVATSADRVLTVGQSLLDETHLKSRNFFHGRDCAYAINADGLVYNAGTNSVTPPAEYRPGSVAPSDQPLKVVGNSGVGYLLLTSGKVLKFTASGSEYLTGSDATDIATSFGQAEHTIVMNRDGTLTAYGDTGFVDGIQPLLDKAPASARIAVGDKYVFSLGLNGKLTGWSVTTRTNTNNEDVTTVGQLTLETTMANQIFVDIAGVLNDFIFLTNDGKLRGYGDNTNGQLNFTDRVKKVISVSAGDKFLVSVDQDWGIVVWGDVSRALVPPQV